MKYPAKPRRNLSCLTWTPILLICVTFLGLIHLADGYRIYGTANATEEFSPYEKGFVGKVCCINFECVVSTHYIVYYKHETFQSITFSLLLHLNHKIGDPSIPQRVTVNPGTESIKEYAEGSRRLLVSKFSKSFFQKNENLQIVNLF